MRLNRPVPNSDHLIAGLRGIMLEQEQEYQYLRNIFLDFLYSTKILRVII